MTDLLLAIADNAQFNLGILWTLKAVHGLLVGNLLTYKGRIVNLNNLIASQHTGTLGRTITNHVLHTDGVLTDGKLDTDAKERAAQVVVGNLAITGTDVNRMGIELSQNLRHGFLNQLVDVNRIHILIVDDMEQVVELVTTRVDDIQAVA